MNYPEAIDFLYKLRVFGTKLGLENTRELARLNGNPQEKLRFIHVAGTNGKGSTCAILENIYRAHGLRTGLFTSPHLVSFTERIQVNRGCISENDVARLTESIIASLGGGHPEAWPFRPTFFEFVAVLALLYFHEQRCEIVLWETGLGGRLDATNIVTPLASVITNIQHDHQHWLGHTLEEIAAEKAGIIKRHVPVITATPPGPALEVIRSAARREHAPLTIVSAADACSGKFTDLLRTLPLLGSHQQLNAALALAVCDSLSSVIPVAANAIRNGINSVQWAGRLQLLQRGSSKILLDGAHNPDGAKSLAEALLRHFPGRPFSLILGLFRDKAWQEICDSLIPPASRVVLVPVSNERSADPQEVQAYSRAKWPEKNIEKCSTLSNAFRSVSDDPFIVVAGSLHLIGEAMELLAISPGARSERSLNEWDAANTNSSSR